MNNTEYWYWVTNIEGIYNYDLRDIFNVFSGPQELYESSENELRSGLNLPKEKVNKIIRSKDIDAPAELKKLEGSGIRFICMEDQDYPACFDILEDKPFSLYVRGNLPNPESISVGIVGARACTEYGREHAFKFAKRLGRSNIQTISGMAIGIDSECARGSIKGGGKTFAVLGGGVDVIYPRENIELYYEIIRTGGGIISEFPPGTPSIAWQFPYRNRLISAFSDRLIVIEAGLHSGTLSTAMHSLNQGKDVYALPGRLTDRQSEGCNRLIYDGAGVIINIEEFIDDMKTSAGILACNQAELSADIAADEERDRPEILKYFKDRPVNTEYLSKASGIDINTLKILLSELEMEGEVSRISGGYYVKRL